MSLRPGPIDLHAHVLDRDVLARLRKLLPAHGCEVIETAEGYYLARRGSRLGPIPVGIFDVSRRLADMDARGIAMQMLSVPPFEFNYELEPATALRFAQAHNDAMRGIVASHPDRFQTFATLPLQDADAAVQELDRVARWPEVRGVEIGTHVSGENLDSAELERVWAALEARDLAVWVHSCLRRGIADSRLGRYYLENLIGNPLETAIAIASLTFGGVIERHPLLRFGFVHGGGFSPYQLGRWDHGWGCRPESRSVISQPPSAYYRHFFFDCLTHDRAALEFLGRKVSWSQVVLGSDYPFDMADDDPVGSVDRLGLSGGDRAAVLFGNALRFLRGSG